MENLLRSQVFVSCAALTAVIFCAAALLMGKGYRRGSVALGVIVALAAPLLWVLTMVMPNGHPLYMLAGLLLGTMAVSSLLMVPLLTIAGLSEPEASHPSKGRQAGLVLAAWIVGTLLPLPGFCQGIGVTA